MVKGGCFTSETKNGVAFEMQASDGYWVFMGRKDFAQSSTFGASINNSWGMCFPSHTVSRSTKSCQVKSNYVAVDMTYLQDMNVTCIGEHSKHKSKEFMIPDDAFLSLLKKIGYNQQDGFVELMPLLCCVSPEVASCR